MSHQGRLLDKRVLRLTAPSLALGAAPAARSRSTCETVNLLNDTLFTRANNKAIENGSLTESFTFHDLKAAGFSDYDGDKQQFSGHVTRAQMVRYNRKPEEVPALGSEYKSCS